MTWSGEYSLGSRGTEGAGGEGGPKSRVGAGGKMPSGERETLSKEDKAARFRSQSAALLTNDEATKVKVALAMFMRSKASPSVGQAPS